MDKPILKGSDDFAVTLEIIVLFGLVQHSVLNNTTFRKLDLFPSSGKRMGKRLLNWARLIVI
jgi:hypothetical protein